VTTISHIQYVLQNNNNAPYKTHLKNNNTSAHKITHQDNNRFFRFRSSFICQGTSTRRQRSDLFGLRVKLPPVSTSLTNHR